MIEVNTHKYYQLVAIAIVSYLKILSCGLHQTHKKLSKYMKFYYGILGIVATVAVVAAAGYWYVFIAGAPQLDPPIVSTAGTGMTFQLKTFNSKAIWSNSASWLRPFRSALFDHLFVTRRT